MRHSTRVLSWGAFDSIPSSFHGVYFPEDHDESYNAIDAAISVENALHFVGWVEVAAGSVYYMTFKLDRPPFLAEAFKGRGEK